MRRPTTEGRAVDATHAGAYIGGVDRRTPTSPTPQPRLPLARPTEFTREVFVVSPANAAAAAALDTWPSWTDGRLALVGPEGAGKSHLAHIWAERAKAIVLGVGDIDASVLARTAGRAVLLEDADRGAPEDALFHLINRAGVDGASLLITGRSRPTAWPCALPDLRSRLNAMPIVELPAPDDAILEGVLINLFKERHIKPAEDLIPYLVARMERSVPHARQLVERLDETSNSTKAGVSRALARQILEIDGEDDGASD